PQKRQVAAKQRGRKDQHTVENEPCIFRHRSRTSMHREEEGTDAQILLEVDVLNNASRGDLETYAGLFRVLQLSGEWKPAFGRRPGRRDSFVAFTMGRFAEPRRPPPGGIAASQPDLHLAGMYTFNRVSAVRFDHARSGRVVGTENDDRAVDYSPA